MSFSRATVCGNLGEKKKGELNTLVLELSVSYLSTMITHSRSWSPITHILHVIIYIHLKSTRPKQARVIVTDCWEASYKGLFGLWWRERFKNQVIPKNKTKKQKKFIFLLIRPLYLKIIKKLCSPNITVSNQWRSHCLIYWGFLFCPWGEISRPSCVQLIAGGLFMRQCSTWMGP